ncbi:MAG: hypothetical protein R3B48_22235 [Kofleriaceae bacterium]
MGFDTFKLAKLTIEGYEDAKRALAPFDTFEAQYNPETLSMRHQSVFAAHPAPGETANGGAWSHSPPARLTVNLIVDGTHVGHTSAEQLGRRLGGLGPLPSVAEQISHLLATCYRVRGKTHEPAHLRLRWGHAIGGAHPSGRPAAAPCFDCRLESVDITYQAFHRDGSPLHAELAAVFVESLPASREAALTNRSSPDLTHRRVVVAGDTLPLLCREIYGSQAYYLRVAQVNGLDDFRALTPGQELIFPPFERARRS